MLKNIRSKSVEKEWNQGGRKEETELTSSWCVQEMHLGQFPLKITERLADKLSRRHRYQEKGHIKMVMMQKCHLEHIHKQE